jgi:hypothetical protein
MSRIYGPRHRALQDRFDMRRLADGVEQRIVRTEISAEHQKFIESRDGNHRHKREDLRAGSVSGGSWL